MHEHLPAIQCSGVSLFVDTSLHCIAGKFRTSGLKSTVRSRSSACDLVARACLHGGGLCIFIFTQAAWHWLALAHRSVGSAPRKETYAHGCLHLFFAGSMASSGNPFSLARARSYAFRGRQMAGGGWSRRGWSR